MNNSSGELLEVPPQCSFYEWSLQQQQAGLLRIFSTISVLTILVVIVVLGNSLVIAAVLLRRRLRSATGILILSLAVADLLVGAVILPFSIANEVLDSYWIFGKTWCTVWVTMDIWMCTASIYNLVAISIDRYIAIIKPLNYPMMVTKFRAKCIVAFVWVLSFIICTPSFIVAGEHRPASSKPSEVCKCSPTNGGSLYIRFSASSSFYLPMIVVIFVYVRIYIAARAATKSIYSGMMSVTQNANRSTKSYVVNNSTSSCNNEPKNKDNVPMLRVHRGSSISTLHTAPVEQRIINVECCRRQQTLNGTSTGGNSPAPLRSSSEDISPANNSIAAGGNASANGDTPASQRKLAAITTMKVISEKEMASTDGETSSSPPLSPPPQGTPPRLDADTPLTAMMPSGDSSVIPSMCNNDQPPTTKWRVKSPPSNPLSRLLRRAPKKKSGCAYEKRLSLEIKAAKTVAIVTGCFIFCWLGFAIIYGFELKTNDSFFSVIFWLGYLNSALNPVIYTVFNREFRTCFKRLLTCHRVNHTTHVKTVRAGRLCLATLCCCCPCVPQAPAGAGAKQHPPYANTSHSSFR